MGETVLNVCMKLLNIILNFFIDGINFIFSALPDSPFTHLKMGVNIEKYLGYLAWLIPVKTIVSITLLWLPCLLVFFGVSFILRWLKMIE